MPRVGLEAHVGVSCLALRRLRQLREPCAEARREMRVHSREGSSSSVRPKRRSCAASAASRSSCGMDSAKARSHFASSAASAEVRGGTAACSSAGGRLHTSSQSIGSALCASKYSLAWEKCLAPANPLAGCRQHRTLWRPGVDLAAQFLRVIPPQHEDDVSTASVDGLDYAIREMFPTLAPVCMGAAKPNRQRSVQQQHSLAAPKASGSCGLPLCTHARRARLRRGYSLAKVDGCHRASSKTPSRVLGPVRDKGLGR